MEFAILAMGMDSSVFRGKNSERRGILWFQANSNMAKLVGFIWFFFVAAFTLASLMCLSACTDSPAPLASTNTSNPAIPVDVLFEYDGCKMIRFSDGFHTVYFAKCAQATNVQTSYGENCGKNCVEDVTVHTETDPKPDSSTETQSDTQEPQ